MGFYQADPTLENYWRGLILFEKNVAFYKFALAHAFMRLIKGVVTSLPLTNWPCLPGRLRS